jgi:hypothetical protein
VTAVVVPYEPPHLMALECRALEEAAFSALGGVDRAAAMCNANEIAYSVMVGDRPVACIGVTEYWRGVGAAWAFLAPDACRYFKTIHAGVRMFINGAMADGEFHRIETSVLVAFPAGHRWALRLGFVPEGLRRKYGPDRSDYISYARVAP